MANKEPELYLRQQLGDATLPRRDHGRIDQSPLELFRPSKDFTLQDGRVIRIGALHQFELYTGWWGGLPQDPLPQLVAATGFARSLFSPFAEKPAVLRPELQVGTTMFRYPPGEVGEAQPWEILPMVCSIGLFRISPDSPNFTFSEATIIWCQDNYGPPTEPSITSQIEALDWDEHAEIWEP